MKELTKVVTVEITFINKTECEPTPEYDERFKKAFADTLRAMYLPANVNITNLQNFIRDEGDE